MVNQFLPFAWATADPFIAHNHDPFVGSGNRQPDVIPSARLRDLATRTAWIKYVFADKSEGTGDIDLNARIDIVDGRSSRLLQLPAEGRLDIVKAYAPTLRNRFLFVAGCEGLCNDFSSDPTNLRDPEGDVRIDGQW